MKCIKQTALSLLLLLSLLLSACGTVPGGSEASFSLTEFKELFISQYPTANLSGSPSNWFTNIQQTETGAVLSLEVGGVSVSGTQLRTLLGLRSTTFTIDFTDTEVIFSVTGYGHGVGMSQYGANVLAEEGATCQEILEHYYTGATVELYQDDGA